MMARVRRLVVKIGSNVLTTRNHKLSGAVIKRLVEDVVELRAGGMEVAIITSGAVAAGMGQMGLDRRPEGIAEQQALAAIGQVLLMDSYKAKFRQQGVPVGQVLLTAEDILGDRRRYVNLENTFRSLFAYGAVPLINENDSVAVAELRRNLGENDMLAAYVANLIRADMLVVFSDVEGLYEAFGPNGPEGELVREVRQDGVDFEAMIGRTLSSKSRGGMATKLQAARLLMACGEMTSIAHARKHRLTDIVAGADMGTLFLPQGRRLGSRKRWIGLTTRPAGTITVDAGAAGAACTQAAPRSCSARAAGWGGRRASGSGAPSPSNSCFSNARRSASSFCNSAVSCWRRHMSAYLPSAASNSAWAPRSTIRPPSSTNI